MLAGGRPYIHSTTTPDSRAAEFEAKRIKAIRAMEDWLNTASLPAYQQQGASPTTREEQQVEGCPYPTQEIVGGPVVLEEDPFFGPSGALVSPANNLDVGHSFSLTAQMPQESTQQYSLVDETAAAAAAAASSARYQQLQLQRRHYIASLIDEQQHYLHSVASVNDNDEKYFINNVGLVQPQQPLVPYFKSETKTIIGKALEKHFGEHADPDVAFVLDVKRRCVDEPMSASEYSRSVLQQGVSCKKIIVAVMMYWKGQFPNRDILRWKSAVQRASLQLNKAK